MRTRLCDLLGIEFPIIQAGMGPFTSAELAAAVSNAGGLGTLGAAARSLESLKAELARLQELTDKPFAVNHIVRFLDKEAFALTLKARPALISFAIDKPGELVKLAHDAGIPVMLQVPTVQRAQEAVSLGVDIIVAQGAESGGFAGTVSTLALVPQVVDVAGSIPVVAAGGIADGRGLAAALILGAQGINLGTRFLASAEGPISAQWKQNIVSAQSEDTIKFEAWDDIFPPGENAYPVLPRMLPSPFAKKWMSRRDEARRESERLQAEVETSIGNGTWGDLMPFTGQTAGLIDEVLPAGEIVRRIAAEAEETLRVATKLLS